mgnify:CR=1 FL=1
MEYAGTPSVGQNWTITTMAPLISQQRMDKNWSDFVSMAQMMSAADSTAKNKTKHGRSIMLKLFK